MLCFRGQGVTEIGKPGFTSSLKRWPSQPTKLHEMATEDQEKVRGLGRQSGSALRVHNTLLTKPLNTVSLLSRRTGLVPNTVIASLKALAELGIVEEMTGRKRHRVYLYSRCMQIMSEEMQT